MKDPERSPSRWHENLLAFVLFLILLGLIILAANNRTPFIYGRF